MRPYELTYLISSKTSAEDLKSSQEKIGSLIQKEGGVIIETFAPFKSRVSLPAKKERGAFLNVLNFNLEPEKLKHLNKFLKEEKGILRYLLLSKKLPRKVAKKPRRVKRITEPKIEPQKTPRKKKEKVELKEIDKKLKEILGE